MNNIEAFVKENLCCGCTTCSLVCPVDAITLKKNEEGFIYPDVNSQKCIHCGLCKKKCAFHAKREVIENEPLIIAAKNRTEGIRMESRSGGVFSLIAEYVLDNQGVVYGVALMEDCLAYHLRVETKAELQKLRGSKYIQSDLSGSFLRVKEDLKAGRKVLFSGTGCQIAAIKSYLRGEDTSNLILIDIVCHGVPSPRIWSDYVKSQEKKYHGKVEKCDFRNKKKFGWEGNKGTLQINGKSYDDNYFLVLFNSGVIERQSCYHCPYKTMNREGDITLGDFWGISRLDEKFNDHKGVSLVFFNTEKGKHIFECIENDCEYLIANKEQCKQSALLKPSEEPKDRKRFWRFYLKFGIAYAKLYQNSIRLKYKLGLK